MEWSDSRDITYIQINQIPNRRVKYEHAINLPDFTCNAPNPVTSPDPPTNQNPDDHHPHGR